MPSAALNRQPDRRSAASVPSQGSVSRWGSADAFTTVTVRWSGSSRAKASKGPEVYQPANGTPVERGALAAKRTQKRKVRLESQILFSPGIGAPVKGVLAPSIPASSP